jgi:hypothetical protein
VDPPRYEALIEACDALLLAPGATAERISVQWLHVPNEHPIWMSLYEDLWDPPQPPAVNPRDLRPAGTARTMARSLLRGRKCPVPPAGDSRFPAKVDALFISNLVSAQMTADGADFYFGRLSEQLADCGVSSITALQNQVSGGEQILRTRLTRGGRASRILLPRTGSFQEELRTLTRARRAASELADAASSARTPFARAVALQAARYARTAWALRPLRLHHAVQRLCRRFQPRAVVVLWEGLAWERMAFHAARTVDPDVRCIGYQHAVLLPRTHALKRALGRGFDPDLILTIGDVTGESLRTCEGLRSVPVLVYGSHRRALDGGQRASDASTRCLVIPEGIESECLTLFDFALDAAVRHPGLEFVLRTHPLLPFERLARRHHRFRTLPGNVRLSDQGDISTDLLQCDWALYRGSSAVVHAVLAGTRPVYLERTGELPIDPLYAMPGWRRRVTTVAEFGAGIAVDAAQGREDRKREWTPARDFCNRYIVAPDVEVVRRLVAG